MTDLVQRLRDSATHARAIDRAALLHEAADEIERLRSRPASSDIVTRLRQTRANMLGTDDEAHYWDCHDAAAEIERLRLTDAERKAIYLAEGRLRTAYIPDDAAAATLRGLLDRIGKRAQNDESSI